MTQTTLAEPRTDSFDSERSIKRVTVIKWFAVIFAVSFILRIAYAGHLYEDDGLWFTACEEVLRGKALYREIYFDKPPGLALVYAALLWVFGSHILTIRLFTILYSLAVSAVLYKFGSRLYDKRTGLVAAAMFAVFSTTYSAGHFQGLNTDLLMVLPYTASAYLMLHSLIDSLSGERDRAKQKWLAVAGGALAGVAFQINPKGVFALVFFAVILFTASWWQARDGGAARVQSTAVSEKRYVYASWLFVLAFAGLLVGSLPFLAYVGFTRSLGSYWLYVWVWGAKYGSYYPTSKTLLATLTRSADYFVLNNTLLVTLVFVAVGLVRQRGRISTERTTANAIDVGPSSEQATLKARRAHGSDAALLVWFVVSFGGLMVGGRLFSHYFFQILPSLCLIGARGLFCLSPTLKPSGRVLRLAVTGMIVLGFVFTMVRFHGRTVRLAADWTRGTRSEANAKWYYETRNREERLVAEVVTAGPESNSTKPEGLEALRKGGPRSRPADGSTDYLFVWGYRPEIYYWSGLLPASRYLSTQPLTGVPADVHYFGDDYRSLLPEDVTEMARAELVRDLEETRPKYIIDELGFFNADLSIQNYPELREFMAAYKARGTTGRFFVYLRKEFLKKHRERRADAG